MFVQSLTSVEHNRFVVVKTSIRANQPGNREKNRYPNVVPFDDRGIVLQNGLYINASGICGFDRDGTWTLCAYIATQGPLESTIDDFYLMILERDVHIIVMLACVVEDGQEKCARYWLPCKDPVVVSEDGKKSPAELSIAEDTCDLESSREPDAPVLTCDFLVTKSVMVKTVEEYIMGPIIKRVLLVYRADDVCFFVFSFFASLFTPFLRLVMCLSCSFLLNKQTELLHPHRVVQLQYPKWPDHGVPSDAKAIRGMIDEVERERASDPNPSRPIVVHCSAGLGRTGTFCAIHQIIMQMRRAVQKPDFDLSTYSVNLYQTVLQMRECRSGMVQQLAQYTFCYRAIIEEACDLKLLDRKFLSVIMSGFCFVFVPSLFFFSVVLVCVANNRLMFAAFR